ASWGGRSLPAYAQYTFYSRARERATNERHARSSRLPGQDARAGRGPTCAATRSRPWPPEPGDQSTFGPGLHKRGVDRAPGGYGASSGAERETSALAGERCGELTANTR